MPSFKDADMKPFSNVFIGKQNNRNVMIFDYKEFPIEVRGLEYSTYFCFELSKKIPSFHLQKLELSDNIHKAFNKSIFIRFEDDLNFNRTFRLKSDNKQETMVYFTKKLRNYLLQINCHWSVETYSKYILLYLGKSLIDPQDYNNYLYELDSIVEEFENP